MTQKDKTQEEKNQQNPENINAETEQSIQEETSELSEEGKEIVKLNEIVEALEKEALEQKDKYLRLYADFENFRRRMSKEKLELVQTASEGVISSVLPVLDDFDRAIKSMEKTNDIASIKEGIELIYHKFYKLLQQKGLNPMETVGKEFDMDLHESITQIPAPSSDLKGKVVDEVEKGYYLNEKVIRFAKVIIGA